MLGLCFPASWLPPQPPLTPSEEIAAVEGLIIGLDASTLVSTLIRTEMPAHNFLSSAMITE